MATIKDIAEKAGVSIGTIDRIIHNRGRYSARTAARVQSIIRETGYRPNLMARNLSKSGTCRIGVLLPLPEQDSGYWSLPLGGIQRAGGELEPFGLSLEIRHYNRYRFTGNSSFAAASSELLSKELDGLLITPLLESSTLEFLDRVKARIPDLPVILFDTDLPKAPRLSYIGQDSYQSGRLAARLMDMLVKGKSSSPVSRLPGHPPGVPRILIITPDSDNEHLKKRIRGFTDHCTGELEILKVTVESDHNLGNFHKLLDSELQKNSQKSPPGGIFVVDAATHFVADFLASSDFLLADRPSIVGYDLVPENCKWLKDGVIDFLLTQRPAEQGYNGVNRLFRKIFLDENAPEIEYTPIDIVTKENLDYLIDRNPREVI